jgi:hypothetical protein
MKQLVGLLAAMAALVGAAGASFAEDARAYARRVDRLHRALVSSDCAGALPDASTVAADPQFSTLEKAKRRDFLGVLGECALKNDDAERAFRTAEQAVGLEPSELWAQLTRMSYGHRFGAPAITVSAFRSIAASNPAQVRALEAREVQAVINAAQRSDPTGAAARDVQALLAALRTASPPP